MIGKIVPYVLPRLDEFTTEQKEQAFDWLYNRCLSNLRETEKDPCDDTYSDRKQSIYEDVMKLTLGDGVFGVIRFLMCR